MAQNGIPRRLFADSGSSGPSELAAQVLLAASDAESAQLELCALLEQRHVLAAEESLLDDVSLVDRAGGARTDGYRRRVIVCLAHSRAALVSLACLVYQPLSGRHRSGSLGLPHPLLTSYAQVSSVSCRCRVPH